MNKNGNVYTFTYASAMVILVAAILSVTSINLKPLQDENIKIEKKQNILRSVNIITDALDADEVFDKTVPTSYIVNIKGEKVKGEAFLVDLKKEHAKPVEKQKLPVFIANLEEKGKKYILPLRGAGLWGPIWGYVALDEDMTTIYGASFNHEQETPGLGAKISQEPFQGSFKGKTIFDSSGNFTSIIVAKTGEKADPSHSVDGISGSTFTAKGVQQMLYDNLSMYKEFFKNKTR